MNYRNILLGKNVASFLTYLGFILTTVKTERFHQTSECRVFNICCTSNTNACHQMRGLIIMWFVNEVWSCRGALKIITLSNMQTCNNGTELVVCVHGKFQNDGETILYGECMVPSYWNRTAIPTSHLHTNAPCDFGGGNYPRGTII